MSALLTAALIVGTVLALFTLAVDMDFGFGAMPLGGLAPFAVPRVLASVFLGAIPAAGLSLFAVRVLGPKHLKHWPWLPLAVGPLVTTPPAFFFMLVPLPWALVYLALPLVVGWPSFILAARIAHAFVPVDGTDGHAVDEQSATRGH